MGNPRRDATRQTPRQARRLWELAAAASGADPWDRPAKDGRVDGTVGDLDSGPWRLSGQGGLVKKMKEV